MILRRVIAHFRKQEWTAIGIDFVIVVLGVFLGIQVANWNEARRDRADEVQALRALHEEVASVEYLSSRILTVRLNLLRQLGEGVDAVAAGDVSALSGDHCVAMASSHEIYVGLADLPTLSELQAAGRSRIMRDDELLAALGALDQSRDALAFAQASFTPLLVNVAQAHPEIFRLAPRTIRSANSPQRTERDYTATCDFARLTGNTGAINALIHNLEYFDAFARDGLIPWAERVGAVHARLDEILEIAHDERAEATP